MIVAGEDKRQRHRDSGWWGDETFASLFAANAAAHPDRLALVDAPNRGDFGFGEPQRLNYAELAAEIDRLAGALVEAGIGKDDVLLVQLPNISEFVALYFAAAKIGAIVSPAAVQYRSHELKGMIGVVAPKAFVCATAVKGCDHVGVAEPLLGGIRLMTFGPNPPEGALDLSTVRGDERALAAHVAANPVDADDIFTICWTSGTTGVPKGVPRSHNHWIAVAGAGYEAMKVGPGDVLLNPFPLINMASIGGITMCWLTSAGTMVLHHPFDPGIYLKQIAIERPSLTIAPPAVLNMLLQNEALLASVDLSSLRVIASGSAPLAPAMVRGFQEKLGIIIVNVFGSNEGMSFITGEGDMPDPDKRASLFPRRGTYRRPYGEGRAPNIESRLVPPGGGDAIEADGVSGELQIRGPTLFEGYHNAPERTAEAFTDDGWFRTGDLFEIAEGGDFYRFVGRCKDLIIRGGVNISPEEIDQLLGGHPLLAEACTFSLPDPTMGERIGLAYVPRGEGDVGIGEVADYLRGHDLAVFKLPERLFRFDALPRNVTNKVMRSEVREMALATLERKPDMAKDVFILGGAQTDFSRNLEREGGGLFELFRDVAEAAFVATGIEPKEVETAHVGNFVGELFAGQGQLGGFFGHVHPDLAGIPASRHEAACASGSIAILAAAAEIEAERYGLALVLGIELMRNVPGQRAAEYLGAAAWAGREAQEARYLWPYMFARVAEEYDERFGLDRAHLRGISANNFANAKRNPNSQTRGWAITDEHLGENDAVNPLIEGSLRKSDCGQVTDGAAAIFLASPDVAEAYAKRRGISLESIPRIKGWGHATAPLLYSTKVADSRGGDYVFPSVRKAMMDALRRAGMPDIYACDGVEVHDCFSITEYMAIDHFGITKPGESWRAVEDGTIALGGKLPVNPSGGLIGLGHPVGATGVRMLLDSWRQVTGNAGDYQVEGAKNFATFNVGGSATTAVSFVVGT